MGIYKFENNITHLCYIGQSINIEERYKEHIKKSKTGTNKFYQAIQQYGINNFTFSILEECPYEELDNREIYWINYYDSFFNGYNSTTGGSQYHTQGKLTAIQVTELHQLLKNSQISYDDLAKQFNVSIRTIYDINAGNKYKNNSLNYPLRPHTYQKTLYYCPECGAQVAKKGNLCINCFHKTQRIVTNRPNRNELKQLIRTQTFRDIGKEFNVSDSAIKKWCKTASLPSTKKEINKYSDEEWELI